MKKMQWTDPVTEAVLINSESVLDVSTNDNEYSGNGMPGIDVPDDNIAED